MTFLDPPSNEMSDHLLAGVGLSQLASDRDIVDAGGEHAVEDEDRHGPCGQS